MAAALILLTSVVCSAFPHADSAALAKNGPPSPKDLPWPYGTGVPGAKTSTDASTKSLEKESSSDDLKQQSGGDEEEHEEEKKASIEVTSKKDFDVESSFSDFTSRDRGKYGYAPGKDKDEGKMKQHNEKFENEDANEDEEGEDEEGEAEDSSSEKDDTIHGGNSDESGEESDEDDSDEDRDDEDDEKEITENRKELTRGYYRRTGPGYVPPHFRVATSVTSSVSAVFSSRNSRYQSLKKKIEPNEDDKKEKDDVRNDKMEDDEGKENEEGNDVEEGGDKKEEKEGNDGEEGDEQDEDAEEKENGNEIEEQYEDEEKEQKVERKTPVSHPFFTIVSSSASGKNEPSTERIYKKNAIKADAEIELEVAKVNIAEEREGEKHAGVEEKDEDEDERYTDSDEDEVELNENSDEDGEEDGESSSSEEDSPAFIVLNNDNQSPSSYGSQNFRLTGSPNSSKVGDELLLFLPVVDKSSSSVSRVRALSSRLSKNGKPLDLHPAALGEHIEGYVTNLDHEDTAHFIGELTKVLDDDDSRSNEDDEQDGGEEGKVENTKEDDGMTFPGQYPEVRKKMTLSPGGTGRTFTVYRRAQNNVQSAQSRGEVPSHFRIPGHRSQSSRGVTSKTSLGETEPKRSPIAREENDKGHSKELDQSEENIKAIEIKSKPETIIITARPIYPSSEVTTEQPKIGLSKEKIKEITRTYSEFLSKYRESRVRNAQTISSSVRIKNDGNDAQTTGNKLHSSQSTTLQKSDSSGENVTPKSSLAILESMQLERAMLEKLLKKISVSESNSSSEAFDEPMSESMESFLNEFQVPEPVLINIADSSFDEFSDELEDPNEKIISVPMPTLVNLAKRVSVDSSSPVDFVHLPPPSLSKSEEKVPEDYSMEDDTLPNSEESLQQEEKSVGAVENSENLNPINMQLNEQNINKSSDRESPEREYNVEQIAPSQAQSTLTLSIESQSAEIGEELTRTNGHFSKSNIYFPQHTLHRENVELSIEDSIDLSKEEIKVPSSEVDDAEDLLQLSLESTEHFLTQDSSEEESVARLSLQQYGLPQEELVFPGTQPVKSIQGSTNSGINSLPRQQVQVFEGSTNRKQLQSLITQSAQDLLLHTQPHQSETQWRSEQSKSNNLGNRHEVALTDGQSRQPELLQMITSEGKGSLSRDGGVVHVDGQLQRFNEGSSRNIFPTGGEDASFSKDEESFPSVLEQPRAIVTNIGVSDLKTKHIETVPFQQPQDTKLASDFSEIGDQIDKLPSKQIFEDAFLQADNEGSRSKSLPSVIQKEVNGLRQRIQSRGKSLSQPSQVLIAPVVSTEKSREIIQMEFTAKLREMIEKQSKLATSTEGKNQTTLTDNLRDLLPEQGMLATSSPLSEGRDVTREMVTEGTFSHDSDLQFTQTEQTEVLSTILPLREQLKRLRERDRLEAEQLALDSQSENFRSQQDREKALQSQNKEIQSESTNRLRDMIADQNKQMLNQSIDQNTEDQRQRPIQTFNAQPLEEPLSSLRSQVDALEQNVQSQATAIPDTMIHVTVAPTESHNDENKTEVSRKLMQNEFTSRLRQMINEQSKVTQTLSPQTRLHSVQQDPNPADELPINLLGKEIDSRREQRPRQFTSRQRQMVNHQARVTESDHTVPTMEFVSRPGKLKFNETRVENVRLSGKAVPELSSTKQEQESQGQREIMQSEFTSRLRQMIANQTVNGETRLPSVSVAQLSTVSQQQDESQRKIMQNEFTARLKQMIANQTQTNVNQSENLMTVDSNKLGQKSESSRETMQRQFTGRLRQMVANQTVSKELQSQVNSNEERTQASANSQRQHDAQQKEITTKQMVTEQTRMADQFTFEGKSQTRPSVEHTAGRNEQAPSDVQRQLMQREFTARLRHMVNTVSKKNMRSQLNTTLRGGVTTSSSHQAIVVPSGKIETVHLVNQQDEENNRGAGRQNRFDESLSTFSDSQVHAKEHSQQQSQQMSAMNLKNPMTQLPKTDERRKDLGDQSQSFGNEQRLSHEHDRIHIGKDLENHSLIDIHARKPSQKHESSKHSQGKHLPAEFLVSDIDGQQMETVPAVQLSSDLLLSSLSDKDERVPPSQVVLLPDDEFQMERIPARQFAPERLIPNKRLEKEKSQTSSLTIHQSNSQTITDAQFRIPAGDTVSSVQKDRPQPNLKMSGQRIQINLNREIGQGEESSVGHSHQEAIPGGSSDVHTNGQSGRHGKNTSRKEESTSFQTQNIRGRQETSGFNFASEQSIGKAIAAQDRMPFIEEKFVVKINSKTPREMHQDGISSKQIQQRTQSQIHSRPLAGVLNTEGRIHTSEQISDRRASIEAMQALAGQSIAFPASRSQQTRITTPGNGRRSQQQSVSVDTPPNVTSFRPLSDLIIGAPPSGHFGPPQNVPDTRLRNNPFTRVQNAPPQQTEQHIPQPFRPQNPTIIRHQNDFLVRSLNEPSIRTQNAKTLRQQNIRAGFQQNLPQPLHQNSLKIEQQQVAHTPITKLKNIPITRMPNTGQKDEFSFPTDQIRLPEDQFSMGPLVTLDSKVSKARQFTHFRIPGPVPSTESSKFLRNNPTSSASAASVPLVFTPSSNNRARSIDNSRKLTNNRHEDNVNSQIHIPAFQMVTDLINEDIRALNPSLHEESTTQSSIGSLILGRGRTSNAKQVLLPPDNISVLPTLDSELLSANVQVRSPSGKLYIVPRTFLAELYEGSDNNPFGDPTIRISQARALLEDLLQRRHQETIRRTRRSALSKSIGIPNEQSVRDEQLGSRQFDSPVSTSDERLFQLKPEDRHSSEATLTRPYVVYADNGAYLVQSDGQKILIENAVHVRYH